MADFNLISTSESKFSFPMEAVFAFDVVDEDGAILLLQPDDGKLAIVSEADGQITFATESAPGAPSTVPGPVGPSGAAGVAGDTGPAGPQGPAGSAGVAGTQGPQGIQGPAGPTGPQGAASTVPGPQGATGNTGPAGPTGPQGAASTVPGPQGATGNTGPAGPTGPQGPAGNDGAAGAQGIQGPIGNTGPAGPTGPTGPQGPAGAGVADSRMHSMATDFAHANAVQDDFIMAAVSAGTFATVAVAAALSPNHPGVVQPRSSTTANSGVQCATLLTAFRIGGGEQFDFNFFTAPVLTTITMRAGALDTATVTAPVDGVYFEMAASGVIVGKTRSNSVESATATLATLAASTWYHGQIVVNAGATSAQFTVYNDAGTSLGTAALTTNIPTAAGREVGWGAILTSSGVVAIELGHWDRIKVSNPGRVVARGAA
jgi:Collagen triple helix repeat (20 copies)